MPHRELWASRPDDLEQHLEALLDERDLGSLHQADTEPLQAEYRTMV